MLFDLILAVIKSDGSYRVFYEAWDQYIYNINDLLYAPGRLEANHEKEIWCI